MPRSSRRRKPRYHSTPTHENPATFVATALGVAGMLALVYLPLAFESQFGRALNPWYLALFAVSLLALPLFLVLHPIAHRFWRISSTTIESFQVSGGGRYSKVLANEGFCTLEVLGPCVLARQRSGKVFLWPRWLRHDNRTYTFELDQDRVRLRALDLAAVDPGRR